MPVADKKLDCLHVNYKLYFNNYSWQFQTEGSGVCSKAEEKRDNYLLNTYIRSMR